MQKKGGGGELWFTKGKGGGDRMGKINALVLSPQRKPVIFSGLSSSAETTSFFSCWLSQSLRYLISFQKVFHPNNLTLTLLGKIVIKEIFLQENKNLGCTMEKTHNARGQVEVVGKMKDNLVLLNVVRK